MLIELSFACVPLILSIFVQEQEIISGPMQGAELTAVKVFAESGPLRGRELDAAAVIGKEPGALLFIHELTRNTAPVIRGLDQIVAERAILGMRSFTILLSDDRTASETRLRAVNGSLKLESPIVLGLDGVEGPGNYALNRKCTLTLVLTSDGKVRHSIGFTDTGAQDLPRIERLVNELTGPLPEDPEALRTLIAARLPEDPQALRGLAIDQALRLHELRRRLREVSENRGRMGRNAGPPERREADPPAAEPGPRGGTEGKPPSDPELQSLLRELIRKSNDDLETDRIFAEIEERAKGDASLQAQVADMFRLLLHHRDRYGTARAHRLAESYLRERESPRKKL